MVLTPTPVVLRGDDAINAILSLALPGLLATWDGTTERVAVIEHDGDGNVRAAFRSRSDAASDLRFRATQTVGPLAARYAEGARTLEQGAPPGQVHAVIVGAGGCDVGELQAEQLRNPTCGPAPITLPELAGLAVTLESRERALSYFENAQLFIRAESSIDVPEIAHLCRLIETRWTDTSALAVAIAKATTAVDALAPAPAVARTRHLLDALSIALGQRSQAPASMTKGGSA